MAGGALDWAGKPKWPDNLIWGGPAPEFILDTAIGHLTVSAEYPSDPPIHTWTGGGDLMLGGITYTGVGPDVISVRIGQATEREDARIQVTLTGLDTPELKRAFFEFRGRVIITVRFVYSVDDGNTWRAIPRFFRGLYSRPQMRNNTLTFEVATYQEDLDRGYEQNWSDSSQRADFPGDLGFQHLVTIAEGGELMTRWPP